ncbi:MAG: LytTR family DNA-binding domain-containing protein [Bacteroidota bacterium]|nr:LytTR family DNA-binding domain-containing protein [Bacteroidota bacterium]MDP3144672.1 LytTR family DNA-binding domain-containing protein [Bacteroidota bacterium]MDP3557008.1 LytTR family DNA-binding domain-containing protein [Bacteroidota bacterium]
MLRAIIIDDEPIGINTLKILIERLDLDVFIVATSSEPEKGIELIESFHPDVIFLDVNMPKLNGFELLDKLIFKDFKLVFTTAHQEYALKAIKNKAFDYLLKPIDSNDLKTCIESIINAYSKKDNNTIKQRSLIEIAVNDGVVILKQNQIIRLEASGSYTVIYLKDGVKHTASKNLKHFESLLDPTIFNRCHLSHIINLNEMTKLISSDGYFALMSDQSQPEVGKKQKDILLEKLKSI